jgi:hypothetical protein
MPVEIYWMEITELLQFWHGRLKFGRGARHQSASSTRLQIIAKTTIPSHQQKPPPAKPGPLFPGI